MKTIGDRAREFRESKQWNTTRMAKEVGTSRQNIESLEAAGDRTPRYIKDLASTRKLALALIGQLADNPHDHARIAAMIELSIAPVGKKVA